MLPDGTFFDGDAELPRIGVLSLLAYVALMILLRAAGKGTPSKRRIFDFVGTATLGSTATCASSAPPARPDR